MAAGVAGGALVYVHAHGALRREALLAEALPVHALGVVGAVEVGLAKDVHVDLFAGHGGVRLGLVALRADAVVARHCVLANGIPTARLVQCHTFVDVCNVTRQHQLSKKTINYFFLLSCSRFDQFSNNLCTDFKFD